MEIVPIIFEQTLWDDFPYVSKSEVESKKNKENLIPSILRDFFTHLEKNIKLWQSSKRCHFIFIKWERDYFVFGKNDKGIKNFAKIASPLPISSNKMFGLLFAVQQ